MNKVSCIHRIITLVLTILTFSGLASTTTWAQNEQRFVPDVAGAFNALSHRPDPLGFFRGDSPNPSSCKHYQGIVRVQNAEGEQYFIVSRSGVVPDGGIVGVVCTGDDDPGNLLIVRMASRADHGERMRSNRLQKDVNLADTAPPSEDTVVNFFSYDGTVEGFPNYGHPGGMQVVDDILVVALDTPYISGDPEVLFVFYNISDPENPLYTSNFAPEDEGVKSGSAGITRLANGHYLLNVTGEDNSRVWFYESNPTDGTADGPTDLSSTELTWATKDVWEADPGFDLEDVGGITVSVPRLSEDEVYAEQNWPNEPAHQTLQFLREGDINGTLYLAGAFGKPVDPFADDVMDLYRVDFDGDQIRLKSISRRVKNSHPSADQSILSPGNNTANFAAGSTFYVSPSGELLFYCTEHDNDGPGPGFLVGDGSIKVGEWRHIDMVRHDSPTYNPSVELFGPFEVPEGGDTVLTGLPRPPITKAWIQLWTHDHYDGHYVVVDFADWGKDSFDDFGDLDGGVDFHEGFNDEASSWRWFAPETCSIRANDDDFGDGDFPGEHTRTLVGDGVPNEDANLGNVRNDGDSDNMNDELSSVQFNDDCTDYYSTFMDLLWDLNRDGTFETNNLIATFSAAGLDGPSVVEVPASAVHPLDGRFSSDVARVTVTNLPPVITQLAVFDSLNLQVGVDVPFVLQGLPVTAKGEFTDPGTPDHQSASLNWADGQIEPSSAFDLFTDAFGGAVGQLSRQHSYPQAGDFTIGLSVLDDDGGEASASTLLKVLTPAQAVAQIIDLLDQLIAGATSDAERKALLSARQELAGNHDGRSSNGALDMIEKGNTNAAIVKLNKAIADLQEAQAAGANVGSLIALLEQVIASLLS